MVETAASHDAALWAETSRWLEGTLGLHFAPRQWRDLQRGLQAAAQRLGLRDAAACARQALAQRLGAEQQQVLAECLTIGETYFFRDPQVWEQLAAHVLQPLIAARRTGTRHLRLWSAGCSSGEEPWSLAMLVAGLLPAWREWDISILATDLNATALATAESGAYSRWSLRAGLPPQARPFLHRAADGRLHVDAELRRMVRFAPLNLAGSDYPSPASSTLAMDLILCRNVLIYFAPARSESVLERLGGCLAEGGWLVTGAVEVPRNGTRSLAVVNAAGLLALRRRDTASAPQDVPAARRPRVAAPAAIAPPVPQQPRPGASAAPIPAECAAQARACADAGDLVRAEALCRQAIAQDKLDPEWTYLLASILSERGELEQALVALQRTLYLEPQHLLARFALGSLELRRGQAQAGHRHLARALARLSGYPAEEVLPGSGGLTAGELGRIIRAAGGAPQ